MIYKKLLNILIKMYTWGNKLDVIKLLNDVGLIFFTALNLAVWHFFKLEAVGYLIFNSGRTFLAVLS